jgi:cytosine/adenosine deaminase-related metal-dependent hydrolase
MGKVLMDKDSPDGLLEDTDDALAESERLIEQYHGAADGRIRYAVTPRFAVTCTEACLRGARELADRYDGVRIHTHASETTDEVEQIEAETGMRNVAWLDEVGLTGEDVVLAHGVRTNDAEREILESTGTHVVHCPSANMKLGSGIAPVAEYLDREISVALGNACPPCTNTLDPFTEMRQACLLAKVADRDATALPAATALRVATLHGGRAAGCGRVDALREGWRADVIGLRFSASRTVPDRDPISTLVYAARGDDVDFSMVDGTVLLADGSVRVGDPEATRARARELAERLH